MRLPVLARLLMFVLKVLAVFNIAITEDLRVLFVLLLYLFRYGNKRRHITAVCMIIIFDCFDMAITEDTLRRFV